MIRVALVIGRLNVGGAEAELVRLARGLDRSRFAPFVVTLQDRGPLADGLGGVEVVELKQRPSSFAAYRALRRVLEERKPDIVQSFLFRENVMCRRIGVGAVVSGLQGAISDDFETGPSPKLWVERATFDAARRTVSNSIHYRDLYVKLGFDAKKIVVIPSSVEAMAPADGAAVRREYGIKDTEVVVTCVARLVERKGHEDLIRAGTGYRLLFVGDGPFRRRLEGRGAILAGTRRDIPAVLAASDIVVLPSRFGEGCPNAALEAMAAGRPVVAARSGGTPEVVIDGETGVLYPPGDVQALRRALERLAADPARRQRLGEAGRARVRSLHSPEAMGTAYEALYQSLTGPSPQI